MKLPKGWVFLARSVRKGIAIELEQRELILCGECEKYKPHDKRCKYWNHGVKPDDFCSKAEPWRGEEHD